MAVTVHASSSSPAPAAIPIAADSQIAAAVVNPCTDPRRKMMMPAPRKPMPETIWAATRDGSTTTRSGLQNVAEPVLADEKYQRRRGADDGLGANAGALALQFALEADERRQAERDEQLDDLTGALPRTAEERRVRCQPEVHANKLAPDIEIRLVARRSKSSIC